MKLESSISRGLAGALRRELLLVYSLPPQRNQTDARHGATLDFDFTWASAESVKALFRDDQLCHRFLGFLATGFSGLVFHRHNTWVAYAWMTNPSTAGPPHLPNWTRELGANWIFYCRTRQGFRGRGLYKCALQMLIREAFQESSEAKVMIDTSPANIPSRRAILATGFEPKGAIVTHQLAIPRVARWAWGSWDEEFKHPPMPEAGQTTEIE